ncbi:hypothetical protein [Nesterenkonia sandarakina]|uniref:Uncharacterized protein n=1 Tax=Nesterenkonia sandarakina TaxID=272918 RepID=A0A7Z0EAV9_9MICC|nr:hypothetical protein [Nesterenkonia sandarakina]NYJ18204.1 hypothetical protein [Nesterenkonia sandarakina]
MNDLQGKRSGSITEYLAGLDNTITMRLDAPSLIADQDTAEIQVQRSTGLKVVGRHVVA